MRIIGCDLHARQQTLAMLDTRDATADLVRDIPFNQGLASRELDGCR